MIGAVIRNELIKTFHRLAFWVGFIFFAGFTIIEHASVYIRAQADPNRTFALPGAWVDIITDDPEAVFIFGSVLLILLVANEFTWRTARQNVIDGVPKEYFFLGKLLLVPFLFVLFMGVRLLAGGFFAWLGTEGGGPFIEGSHVVALGGVAVGIAGFLTLALFIALAVRSGGAAMGVWFLYFAAVENLITAGLVRISESLRPVTEYLPVKVFADLYRYIQWDPVAFEAAVARAAERNRPPPEIWDSGTLVLTALAWIAVMLVTAFLWFRRRDL